MRSQNEIEDMLADKEIKYNDSFKVFNKKQLENKETNMITTLINNLREQIHILNWILEK